MSARNTRRAYAASLLTALLAGAVGGCGSDSTPADEVPALRTWLAAVDQAVSSGHAAAVRRAVQRLERAASDAERSGDLAHADAAAIVSAGDALVAALPPRGHAPATSSSPTPSPSPSLSPSPSEQHTEEAPEPPGHQKPEKGPKPPKPPQPKDEHHGHGPGHEKH